MKPKTGPALQESSTPQGSIFSVFATEDHQLLQELHGVAFAHFDAHAAEAFLLAGVEDAHLRLHYLGVLCLSPKSRFPQLCVVIRISNRLNPRYHCLFLYDEENVTIGGRRKTAGDSRLCHLSFHRTCTRNPNRECAIKIRPKSQKRKPAKNF
jgi:hypothetical protein